MLRALISYSVLAALCSCGGAMPANDLPSPFEEEDPRAHAQRSDQRREFAPAAVRLVRTGTIDKQALSEVLDKGPGALLGHVTVKPYFARGRSFAGWEIVRLWSGYAGIGHVDLLPGDIVKTVNGRSIRTPKQLGDVWKALRSASELRVVYDRGGVEHVLSFTISP